MLKASETKRVKLECDELLPIFAFKFNLRRYTKTKTMKQQREFLPVYNCREAGAYTRPIFSSTPALCMV